MTLWTPTLDNDDLPIYRRIADALERDIRSGLLVDGSQLPTHRELARLLAITPVTVTRAYAEAAQRGLVASAAGRGTFVRGPRRDGALPATEIDLATNVVSVPLPTPSAAALQRALSTLGGSYIAAAGSERHRSAGAAWIGRRTDPARVFVTAGTQNALFLAFAAAARTDETVLCESVTYHGAKAIAQLLRIKLEPLPMDRYGILPDAFERAARGRNVKALFTTPSLQNPTGIVIPDKRRRDLAAAADKHGITIIEDDVCGFLLEEAPTPFATLLPDRTIFLTGLGKAISPALRVGYLVAPDALAPRVQSALAAATLFTSPIVAELAATWIEDGTAAKLAAQKRAEVARRTVLARRILGRRANSADLRSPNLWLEVPRRWTADTFADEARRRNVRVASASSFTVAGEVPRFVRISIAAPPTAGELESALHVLAAIDEERTETVV
ncbi:MAG: hypothetical protein QOH21_2513 [Acidobacteriota bacterium]|jgi:DNA-binding transcriptional MocR family regulator|nr:hypothetical protein [Acidobacteriota bacterium]